MVKTYTKCIKVLNCMILLTGTKWGTNSYTLRTLYFALIRSKIDYGCEVYNSASNTVPNYLIVFNINLYVFVQVQ